MGSNKNSPAKLLATEKSLIWSSSQPSDCVTILMAPPPAALPSAALDPKVASLAQQLEKLDEDLAKEEESILNRLRAPLSRTDPAGDLANRLKEQEVRGLATVSLRHHHLQTHHRVIS